MKQEDEIEKREMKDIINNGHLYTLIKLHRVGTDAKQPCFMNNWGWALHSISAIKRSKQPRKNKNYDGTNI